MQSKLSNISRALVVACALAPLPALADAPTKDATHEVQVVKSEAPVKASSTDATNYAQREKQDDKDVANFQGGNVVVITGGAVLVALLILLLIV